MYVCLSPGGQLLTQGKIACDNLLVGTVDGVFSFHQEDGSWERTDNRNTICWHLWKRDLRQQGQGPNLGEARQWYRRQGDLLVGNPVGGR